MDTHSWRPRQRRKAWRASFSWWPLVRVPMAFSIWSVTKTLAWPARRRLSAGLGCAGCRRTGLVLYRASAWWPAGSAWPPGGRWTSTGIVYGLQSFRRSRGYAVRNKCVRFIGRAVVRLSVRPPVCLFVGPSGARRVFGETFCGPDDSCLMCTPTDSIRRGPVSRSRMRFYIYIARRRPIHPPLLHAGRDLNLVSRATFGTVSPVAAVPACVLITWPRWPGGGILRVFYNYYAQVGSHVSQKRRRDRMFR